MKRFEGGKNNLNPRSEKGNKVGKKGDKKYFERYSFHLSRYFIYEVYLQS